MRAGIKGVKEGIEEMQKTHGGSEWGRGKNAQLREGGRGDAAMVNLPSSVALR